MQTARRARDAWFALRCQAGDPAAFEDLCAEMEQPLFYYALKLVGNQDTALEVLQETWVHAVRGIRKLKDPESVRSWLYALVHGIAIDQIRRERARQRLEEVHTQEAEVADPGEFTFEEAQALHAALDQLSHKHREVLGSALPRRVLSGGNIPHRGPPGRHCQVAHAPRESGNEGTNPWRWFCSRIMIPCETVC